jgi:Tfp pilus assembly protein PilF
VAYSPDGRRLATASSDHTAKVWDAQTGQVIRTLDGHADQVHCVAFSLDGRFLATASLDKTVKVWDAQTGHEALTLGGHTRGVAGVAFSPDGRRLASASYEKTVKVWDARTGQQTLSLQGHTDYVNSLVFSPDGQRLAGAGSGVTIWDLAAGKEAPSFEGYGGSVRSIAFSPDGQRLAGTAGMEMVKLWDSTTGQEALMLKGGSLSVSSVAFSPDGRRLACGSADHTVKVYNTAAMKPPDLETAKQQNLVWHLVEAEDAEEADQWFAALFHLNRLIDAQSDGSDLHIRRAFAHAELEQKDKAARDFAKAMESAPTEVEPWHRFACQRLHRRDREGYRKVCRHLLDHFGKTQDPETANDVAWVCVLVPDAVADPLRPLRLAEWAVAHQPKNEDCLNTLGAAFYRAGKFEEAVKRLNAAIQARGKGRKYEDWLFLAMAHHRLGHADEAQQWLAKAVREIDTALAEKPGSARAQALSWQQRQEMQFLRHEAETLLKDTKP